MDGHRAIPTRYAGVVFRSRLEARWAAFFDEIEWPWDYEPVDFGGWTPDFLVEVPGHGPLFTEVKPATTFKALEQLAAKVETSSFRGAALALGVGPLDDGRTLGALVQADGMGAKPWKRLRTRTELRGFWRAAYNLSKWRPGFHSPALNSTQVAWPAVARAKRLLAGDGESAADEWAALVEQIAADLDNDVYPGVLAGAHAVIIGDGRAAASYYEHSIQRAFLSNAVQQQLMTAAERCGVRLSISILPSEVIDAEDSAVPF